jgi:hypothetical protein
MSPKILFQVESKYGDIGTAYMIGHPTQHWLFLLSNNVEAENLVNVANYEGTVQRYLALCNPYSSACYGWLPNTVTPSAQR